MTETTHAGTDQVVTPQRLRQILIADGEGCYCAPHDHDPNTEWDVTGECPLHGEIWHPGLGAPHPDADA